MLAVPSVSILVTILLGGCAGPSPDDSTPAAGTLSTRSGLVGSSPASVAETVAVPHDPAEEQWVMPNLVGSVLQDAQDEIQSLTGGAIFYTDSHDLTGEDRHQMLDSDWQVCTQDVDPGAPLTTTTQIDFGVVKLYETCP